MQSWARRKHKSSPAGTVEAGRTKSLCTLSFSVRPNGTQDFILGAISRPYGTALFCFPTQDYVLGYLQSSLRD